MREIDGSQGEGGGQLVRNAVALAAISGAPIRIRNVRARRSPPGLAPQHLAAVRAVAAVCGASTAGLALRATDFEFAPGRLAGGDFAFDVGTAGSVTLVAQALLPVLACAPAPSRVRIAGGTDVRGAPPLDYFRHVLLAHLAALGVAARCAVKQRGYFPRGGGEIELASEPARPRALRAARPPARRTIEGCAHVDRLPAHVATRMRDAAREALAPRAAEIRVECEDAAYGPGGAIALWTSDAHAPPLGAARVAERGVRAEALGASAGAELAADLAAGVALDVHAADQLLVWLALAREESCFTTRELTSHAHTAMALVTALTGARFEVAGEGALARVRVQPREGA